MNNTCISLILLSSFLFAKVFSKDLPPPGGLFCVNWKEIPGYLELQKMFDGCAKRLEKAKECTKYRIPANKVDKKHCKESGKLYDKWIDCYNKFREELKKDKEYNKCIRKKIEEIAAKKKQGLRSGASYQVPNVLKKE